MFDNIGAKVKGLAQVVCWLGIITSVIYSIVLFSQSSRYYNTFPIGIGVLVGGVLGSWLGSWALYAIGSAAEDAAIAVFQTNEIRRMLEHSRSQEPSVQNPSPATPPTPVLQPKPAYRVPSGPWRCNVCGTENSASSQFCQGCGEKSPSTPVSQTKSAHYAPSGPWKCNVCGTDNSASSQFCQGCGEKRH